MNEVEWIAIKLAEKGYTWPNNAESAEIAYEVAWRDEFEDEIWSGEAGDVYVERDGLLGYFEGEYDDRPIVTREEYEKFIQENPNYTSDILRLRKAKQAEIAERVKAIQQAVKEVYALAESVAMPLSFHLDGYGVVDPAGDWQSSRC